MLAIWPCCRTQIVTNEDKPLSVTIGQWLTARPANGVLGVLLIASLPGIGIFSCVPLVLLALQRGAKAAFTTAAIVLGLLVVASMLSGAAPLSVVKTMATNWLPCLALVYMLMQTRSMALAIQLSVIAGSVIIAAIHLLVDDPMALWGPLIEIYVQVYRDAGYVELADQIENDLPAFARELALVYAVLYWLMLVLMLQLGHGWYRRLPGDKVAYGDFVDLGLGKVLAVVTVVATVGSYLADLDWLDGVAVFLFTAFMVQGLAVVHWHRKAGSFPLVMVVIAYVLFLPLNLVWGAILALVGYVDAWFGLRKKVVMSN